jgi:AcrR family transcriptional regulator
MKNQSVRDRLFRTGLAAFAEHGYAEVSVDEIVTSAQTTKPMLYYYFGNKAGLYQAIGEEAFAVLRAGYLRAEDRTLDPLERLREFLRADFRTMRENPDIAKFIYRTAYGGPREAPAIDYWKLFMPTFNLVTEIIEAAQARKVIGEGAPPMLALPLFGLISIWSQVHLGGPMGNLLSDEMADSVLGFYLRGVAPPPVAS